MMMSNIEQNWGDKLQFIPKKNQTVMGFGINKGDSRELVVASGEWVSSGCEEWLFSEFFSENSEVATFLNSSLLSMDTLKVSMKRKVVSDSEPLGIKRAVGSYESFFPNLTSTFTNILHPNEISIRVEPHEENPLCSNLYTRFGDDVDLAAQEQVSKLIDIIFYSTESIGGESLIYRLNSLGWDTDTFELSIMSLIKQRKS
ncbi:hypothetical protein QTV49_000403 [Vibrio vulnificus]|nr:hypothetical protein [Vibrio vulnificus]